MSDPINFRDWQKIEGILFEKLTSVSQKYHKTKNPRFEKEFNRIGHLIAKVQDKRRRYKNDTR